MRESGFPFWPVLASGTGAVVLGAAALARPDVGVRVVTAIVGVQVLSWILAVAWIFVGLAGAVLAVRTRRVGLATLAVVPITVGFAFRTWPDMSARALVILTGVGAVVVGLWLIAVAVQLRQLGHED